VRSLHMAIPSTSTPCGSLALTPSTHAGWCSPSQRRRLILGLGSSTQKGIPRSNCATRKLRLPIISPAGAHVTCYKTSLYLTDFKRVPNFGEAQLLQHTIVKKVVRRAELLKRHPRGFRFPVSGAFLIEATDNPRPVQTVPPDSTSQTGPPLRAWADFLKDSF